MATFTQAQGARTLIFDISMVGSGYYGVSPAVDLGPNIPPDVTLEVEADPNGTPTGNKRLMLFAKLSLDNVNFGSGPESAVLSTSSIDSTRLMLIASSTFFGMSARSFSLSLCRMMFIRPAR